MFCVGSGRSLVVMGFVRARLSFAILRASMLCVRGARVKWTNFSPIDVACIDHINFYSCRCCFRLILFTLEMWDGRECH